MNKLIFLLDNMLTSTRFEFRSTYLFYLNSENFNYTHALLNQEDMLS